jgi:hypothetical protein
MNQPANYSPLSAIQSCQSQVLLLAYGINGLQENGFFCQWQAYVRAMSNSSANSFINLQQPR